MADKTKIRTTASQIPAVKLCKSLLKDSHPRRNTLAILLPPVGQLADHRGQRMLHRTWRANLNIVDNFGQLKHQFWASGNGTQTVPR